MKGRATTHPAAPASTGGETAPARGALAGWRRAIRALGWLEPRGQAVVLLALRLLYGWLFARTGWGKLSHLEQTSGFFEGLGLPAPTFTAALVGGSELVGGLLLLAGAGTRLAAAVLSIVMVSALATAHASEAFQSLEAFTEQAPYPFLVATLVLLAFGAGRLSLDRWLCPGAARAGQPPGVDVKAGH